MHLCPDLEDPEQTENMIKKAASLGYRLVAIPLPSNYTKKMVLELRSICKEVKIDYISRVDLKPKTVEDLIKSLRKCRRRFEVIAVFCESKSIARQAAKDRRVDLINFPSLYFKKRFFDKAEAELASRSLTSFEIDINPLIILDGKMRIRLLSRLNKEITIAQNSHVPIIISSGASDELYMRRPRDMGALASLFTLDKNSASNAISRNPLNIIQRNREKLSSKFVAPGISIIRKGRVAEKK
jgi:RNase P/RNase MRP subunit p30